MVSNKKKRGREKKQNKQTHGVMDPTKVNEMLAYISEQLKSGLHPSYMSDEDKAFMAQYMGTKWYEKWGYTEEELHRIV